ncbi:ABC transporter ATP-binding protein [Spiribacter roseus]|uniref:ABC transporter ATP-binding protein n=1 Tax=Spiribacter roseus TaxID=1855875 RepID=A0ABV3RYC5_9GAMM
MQSTNPFKDLPHYLRVFQSYLGSRMYLAFALTLFAGLAEGFGILMLLPLLRGVEAGGGDAGEPATGVAKVMEDMLGVFGWADSTIAVLLVITVAFLLKGALLFGAKGYIAYLRGQLLRELKGELFDCYARMRYRYYVERDTGHFTNVINQQTNLALQAFQTLTQFFTQFISTLVYIALAFVVAWRFGLMALAFGIGLMWLFRRLNHYVRDLSRRKAQENSHLAKLLIQFLHAFKYLTATGQAKPLRGRVTQSVGRLTGYEMRSGIAQAFTEAAREPIAVVAIMLIVIIQLVFTQQPLAPIMVSILLFYRGMNATLSMQGTWQQTLNQIGSLEMVRDEFADQAEHREPDGQRPAPDLAEGITLDRVSFAYDDSLGAVIEDVSVSIPVRTSVALVGESGAGKSTLVDLMTLMLKPQSGEVRVDGIPGSEIELATWRKQIGYVSQETVVFDDTIANNICMWRGDPQRDEALMERIREAARRAHIAHHIETLPAGYQTVVGDRGVRLSGGQRQRLFIARELFRRPNLLILDEATSALDTDSERHIQESIDALKGEITVVIIAHRLSTIRNVDHVYVFDRGRLVEDGAYEALRDDGESRFGRLVAAQAL